MNSNIKDLDKANLIVWEWFKYWYNDPEPNYRTRILNVDANMRHNLIKRIAKAISESNNYETKT